MKDLIMRAVLFAIGVTAFFMLLVMIANGRNPPTPFAARWSEVSLLPSSAPLTPKPIRTVSVPPPKLAEPPELPPHRPPLRQTNQEAPPAPRAATRDICRGKGKTYTKGSRSWRCRR